MSFYSTLLFIVGAKDAPRLAADLSDRCRFLNETIFVL